MLSVKVSTKHQVVVPSEARRALDIRAGDRLTVEITSNGLIMRPRGRRAGARLRGLAREVWQGVEPVEYVRTLRGEWDERAPR
jgi:AbrB family looped-hinge helix DNA binding protein